MIKAQSHKLVTTQLGDSDLFAKWIEIVSKGTSLFSFIRVSYFFSLLSYGFFQKHILQAVLFKVASSGLQRGSFCPFPFLLIYYYGSNKSTEKETGKTHLCVHCFKFCGLLRKPELYSPVAPPPITRTSYSVSCSCFKCSCLVNKGKSFFL